LCHRYGALRPERFITADHIGGNAAMPQGSNAGISGGPAKGFPAPLGFIEQVAAWSHPPKHHFSVFTNL
jgi:hypothetical protein